MAAIRDRGIRVKWHQASMPAPFNKCRCVLEAYRGHAADFMFRLSSHPAYIEAFYLNMCSRNP